MKFKTKQLVDRLANIICQWPGVECISLNEAALPDTLDPYFALIMDIYHSDPIPAPEEREALYGEGVILFETSRQGNKDRFLIDDIPVRLEYKSVTMIDELVNIADTQLKSLWLIKDSGTYTFYRLSHGEIIYTRSSWMDDIRKRLKQLSDEFWNVMRSTHESKMQHFLNDLGAAFMRNDEFFYLISSAGFIKNAYLALFCINRRFEPSHRAYYKQVLELKKSPDSFRSYAETFLRSDEDLTMERKYSVAQLIAREIVAL